MKPCCFELIISVLRANSLMIHHDRSYNSRLAEVSVDCGVNTRLLCNRHRCKPSFVIPTKSKVSKRRRRVRLRAKFPKIIYHAFLDGKFRTNRFSDVLLLFIRSSCHDVLISARFPSSHFEAVVMDFASIGTKKCQTDATSVINPPTIMEK